MERFGGTISSLGPVDVSGMVAWIGAIPLDSWPQGERLAAESPYPAMVSNGDWHGFHREAAPVVDELMSHFPGCVPDHRMLSVVVPGQRVLRHDDLQDETWRVRVHVPLITNPDARMFYDDAGFHLEVGRAYRVNTELPHWLHNLGAEPRVHFFFDVRERSA